jgi:S1-C subfamily serine protease
MQINDLTPDTARTIGTSQTKGVLVASVVNGSPAQRAGLAPQDVITAVNGEPVAMAAEVRDLTTLGVPGQILTLWVEKAARRGSLATIRVQLERASP